MKPKFKVGDRVRATVEVTGCSVTNTYGRAFYSHAPVPAVGMMLGSAMSDEGTIAEIILNHYGSEKSLNMAIYIVALPHVTPGCFYHSNKHGAWQNCRTFVETELVLIASGNVVRLAHALRKNADELQEADDYWMGHKVHIKVERLSTRNWGWKVGEEIMLDGFSSQGRAAKALYQRVYPPIPEVEVKTK